MSFLRFPLLLFCLLLPSSLLSGDLEKIYLDRNITAEQLVLCPIAMHLLGWQSCFMSKIFFSSES